MTSFIHPVVPFPGERGAEGEVHQAAAEHSKAGEEDSQRGREEDLRPLAGLQACQKGGCFQVSTEAKLV